MTQLNGLVLDQNPGLKLNSLFQHMESLKNLKTLVLRNNGLKALPQQLDPLKQLVVLDLGGNAFDEAEQNRIKTALPDTWVIF